MRADQVVGTSGNWGVRAGEGGKVEIDRRKDERWNITKRGMVKRGNNKTEIPRTRNGGGGGW